MGQVSLLEGSTREYNGKRTTMKNGMAGYDSEEEERDLHHQDMYMNGGRNHHFGPPPTQEG